MSGLRVAVVQFDILWEDKTGNYDRVRSLLERVQEPVDLVLLPEMFATGFSMNIEKTAETAEGETVSFLSSIAASRNAHVLGGLMERGVQGGKNTAVVISPGGDVLCRYVKMHPFSFGGEDQRYEKGNEVCVVDVGGMKVSPLICYDLRFPELFREAMARGAELFVVPANWPSVRVGHFVNLLRARAIENLAYVVGVNRVGEGGGLTYPGRSVVFDPLGEPILDPEDREGVFLCDLDPEKVREPREKFGFLGDRRTDRYPFLAGPIPSSSARRGE